MTGIAKKLACAALLCGLCASSGAIGFLGFFFMGKAMDAIGEKVFAPISQLPAAPPSWQVSNGAADLINESLPLEGADGFVILRARSPAPGALEIIVGAPKGAALDPSILDKTWGPGVVELFCGARETMWTRWVKIGGTVGMVVQSHGGEVARRYGATRADCEAIASR